MRLYLAMFGGMLIWGLSWSNVKIAGTYADPQLLMFWRFAVGRRYTHYAKSKNGNECHKIQLLDVHNLVSSHRHGLQFECLKKPWNMGMDTWRRLKRLINKSLSD